VVGKLSLFCYRSILSSKGWVRVGSGLELALGFDLDYRGLEALYSGSRLPVLYTVMTA